MENQILNGVSSKAVTPQLNYVDVIQQLEQALLDDAKHIQALTAQGIITNNQSQYLMSRLVEKARTLDEYKQSVNAEPQPMPEPEQPQNPIEVFNQENPGFFEKEGRNAVLDYLKGLNADKDEISKIAALIEGVEKGAIDGYLKQSAHDKSLNDENMAAKSKLTSYAQNASAGDDIGRIFTREDIGNMSGEEFAKNEKLIYEQAKRGLIK